MKVQVQGHRENRIPTDTHQIMLGIIEIGSAYPANTWEKSEEMKANWGKAGMPV